MSFSGFIAGESHPVVQKQCKKETNVYIVAKAATVSNHIKRLLYPQDYELAVLKVSTLWLKKVQKQDREESESTSIHSPIKP